MADPREDNRPAVVVMRQWREFTIIRNQLAREGVVSGDATADEVLAALRAALPPTLFDDLPPAKR